MKPVYTYRGNLKHIFIIFSVIPFTLILLSGISYFTNPNITTTHLIIFGSFNVFLTMTLVIAAILIARFRLDIYDNHITVIRTFSKQSLSISDIDKFEIGAKKNKLASTNAICFVFFMQEGRQIFLPVRPFEKDRDEIISRVRLLIKKKKKKKHNSQ